MTFERGLERAYRVRFDEAGRDGLLRSSGFLRYAQDLAWLHSESAGFGRDWYHDRGLTWLVGAIELDLLNEVEHGSELRVSTELTGLRRVWARRRSEFHALGSERPVAVAITDWVLSNKDGRPVRAPAEIVKAFGQTGDFTPMRLNGPPVADNASTTEITVRLTDVDPLAHVSHAAYLDYIDETFLTASEEERLPLPRRYRVEFNSPAEPAARLTVRSWAADDAFWFVFAVGARTTARASLEISPGSFVGG